MKGDYLLITVDMDGTLLNSHGEISKRNLASIHAAQNEGIVFSICTGRFPENAAMVMREYGIDCPIIALNGAMITETPFGREISSHVMDPVAAGEVFELLERMDASYFMFGKGLVVTRRDSDWHHSQTHFGDRLALEAGVRYTFGYEACREALHHDLYKYYIYPQPNSGDLAPVRTALGAMGSVALTQSSDTNIEVISPGVDKGRGLTELAAYLQIPLSKTMAIGDQENDIPMIRASGLGVAVRNATATVKKYAAVVTLSNVQDGVALAIERFALGHQGHG